MFIVLPISKRELRSTTLRFKRAVGIAPTLDSVSSVYKNVCHPFDCAIRMILVVPNQLESWVAGN
jgi:hypothetical protein